MANGELPPVEERLPANPLVMSTMEIGTYGGTIRRGFTGPSDYNNNTRVVYDALLRWNAAGDQVVPDYAESYSSNEDFTVWTVTLREGHKWSDGVPFTSADIMFWYESVALNTDLNPNPPSWIVSSTGNVAVVTAPDAQTVVFTYDAPNTAFALELANKETAQTAISNVRRWRHGYPRRRLPIRSTAWNATPITSPSIQQATSFLTLMKL